MSVADLVRVEVTKMVQDITHQALSRSHRAWNEMYSAAQEVLGKDGSGRVYPNGHVASAPGQPPAPDKANLKGKWRKEILDHPNGKGLGVEIRLRMTSNMPYSVFLENGTRKMAARPFHDRIKAKARPAIAAIYSSL